MDKKCNNCKQVKALGEFFQAPTDDAAKLPGTSEFCIECHDKCLINHGYGYYGDKYKAPASVDRSAELALIMVTTGE